MWVCIRTTQPEPRRKPRPNSKPSHSNPIRNSSTPQPHSPFSVRSHPAPPHRPFPPSPPPVSSGGHTPGRDVYLCFGHDEEVGGGEGAARVAAELAARGMAFEFMLDEGLMIVDGGARQGGRRGRGWGGMDGRRGRLLAARGVGRLHLMCVGGVRE